MTAAVLWGSPFKINTLTAGDQLYPKIAALQDGTFVAVWVDHSKAAPDLSGRAIRGQILNADGTRKGGEFLINTTTPEFQEEPCVAVLRDGRFVVAWTDASGQDGEQDKGIRARVYEADGTALGNDFRVNTLAGSDQLEPSIAALSNGGFVITYTDYGNGDGSLWGVRAQAFDADLRKVGGEIFVNQTTALMQHRSAVIGLKEGHYAVFYTDYSNSASDPAKTVRGHILTADGQSASPEFVVPSARGEKELPAAAALSDGRFVVAWVHSTYQTGDGSGFCIKAQIYNADGTMSGGEFVVNTTTQFNQTAPAVTATLDGGFVVAFADGSAGDGYKHDVRIAMFDSSGTRSGPDMVVGVAHRARIFEGITTLADGRIVVTWDGTSGREDLNADVLAQIIDPRGQAIVLNGSAADDQYVGTRFNDVLKGAASNDSLTGEAGNDVLDGGTGTDRMVGGTGDDTYYIDSTGDRAYETASGGTADRVITTASHTLSAYIENLYAAGSASIALTGSARANVIVGNAGANKISAGTGHDYVNGGSGNDKLYGGTGNDRLYGGAGKDIFVFNTKLHKSANVDYLGDFYAPHDSIQLENAYFRKIGAGTATAPKLLSSAFFTIGTKATDANDYIVYNKAAGYLFYDYDGSGKGAAVLFAKVKKGLALTSKDFYVI